MAVGGSDVEQSLVNISEPNENIDEVPALKDYTEQIELDVFVSEQQQEEESTSTIISSEDNSKEKFNELRILVIGETGAGKSTLINAFTGIKKAKVSHGASPTAHELIEKHERTIGPNKVIIYDTKGLVDASSTKDSKLMKEFRDAISENKMDLVFICQRMFGRMNESCDHIVEMIAKYFKKRENCIHIWERCILILTQANTYNFDDDDNEEMTDKIIMRKIMKDWSLQFRSTLRKYGMPDTITNEIPVCAAGTKKILSLPVTENWIFTLYDMCQTRCPPDLKNIVMSLECLRKNSFTSSIKVGAAAGAIIGGIVIPGLGVAPGLTIGGLSAWVLYEQSVRSMEEKAMERAKQKLKEAQEKLWKTD